MSDSSVQICLTLYLKLKFAKNESTFKKHNYKTTLNSIKEQSGLQIESNWEILLEANSGDDFENFFLKRITLTNKIQTKKKAE